MFEQVEIHTDWERKLPVRLLEMVDKTEYKVYPNCRHRLWGKLWKKVNEGGGLYQTEAAAAHTGHGHGELMEVENQAYLYRELAKQKKR